MPSESVPFAGTRGKRFLAVLMYHGVSSPADPEGLFSSAERPYVVDGATLASQVAAVVASAPEDVEALLTFDDGRETDVTRALPVLLAHGVRSVHFVTTDRIGTAGHLGPGQLRELAAAGMAIASHGRTHRFLSECSPDELVEELAGSRRRLEDVTGVAVSALSFPGGKGGRRELEAALQAGYTTVYGSVPVRNRLPGDGRILGRRAVRSHDGIRDLTNFVAGRNQWRPRLVAAAKGVVRAVVGDAGYDAISRAMHARRGA